MQTQQRSFGAASKQASIALIGKQTAILALLLLALVLGGCKSAPPKPPALAERQVQALQSLGFNKNEEGWLLNLPEPISFEFDQAKLKPDMQNSIAGFAAQLLKVEIHKLRIEGHTDNIGPRQINLDLSQRRAEVVAQEFVAHGFAESDIERIGFGPDHPATANDTREGRAHNRRVEIVVPASALALTSE